MEGIIGNAIKYSCISIRESGGNGAQKAQKGEAQYEER